MKIFIEHSFHPARGSNRKPPDNMYGTPWKELLGFPVTCITNSYGPIADHNNSASYLLKAIERPSSNMDIALRISCVLRSHPVP
jgi:hypothetical protein